MTEQSSEVVERHDPPPEPPPPAPSPEPPPPRAAAIIVTVTILAIVALSLWYLVRPQPLLIQGEADATRIDLAARVDGRVATIPVDRGQNVAAGQVVVTIDNPELLTRLKEAEAALRRRAGRPQAHRGRHARRRSSPPSAGPRWPPPRRTRISPSRPTTAPSTLTTRDFASVQKLDEETATLDVARRSQQQAKLALDEAIAGYTKEEHGVAQAAVVKAEAAIATLQAQVGELTVKSPRAAQVYQSSAEAGEFVSPGVPLLTLVDLSDIWLRFDLREDLVKGLKVGDRFEVRVPALGDQPITVEVRTIATRGEYAGWRATRATGDFDLRTFAVRAYPVEAVPGLRPGMSAYADWKTRP